MVNSSPIPLKAQARLLEDYYDHLHVVNNSAGGTEISIAAVGVVNTVVGRL